MGKHGRQKFKPCPLSSPADPCSATRSGKSFGAKSGILSPPSLSPVDFPCLEAAAPASSGPELRLLPSMPSSAYPHNPPGFAVLPGSVPTVQDLDAFISLSNPLPSVVPSLALHGPFLPATSLGLQQAVTTTMLETDPAILPSTLLCTNENVNAGATVADDLVSAPRDVSLADMLNVLGSVSQTMLLSGIYFGNPACSVTEKHCAPHSPRLSLLNAINTTANTITPDVVKPRTSLFSSKSRNAGEYIPRKFDIISVECVMISPPEVIAAGSVFWKDQLVGFFLNKNPPYPIVLSRLKQRWKLKGKIKMRYDNTLFFFEFSNMEDRLKILEAEPIIIYEQPFIITSWSPSVDTAREQVRSIPV